MEFLRTKIVAFISLVEILNYRYVILQFLKYIYSFDLKGKISGVWQTTCMVSPDAYEILKNKRFAGKKKFQK